MPVRKQAIGARYARRLLLLLLCVVLPLHQSCNSVVNVPARSESVGLVHLVLTKGIKGQKKQECLLLGKYWKQ